jgi:hypothetical protein
MTEIANTLSSATIGILQGFDDCGTPLVDFPSNPEATALPAIATVALAESDRGREVVLLFEEGDLLRPIIVGIKQSNPLQRAADAVGIEIDGERIIYTALREIVLRCGKASIQLLSDGSVRIRGTNLLSRASATNRIRGGNVQIN